MSKRKRDAIDAAPQSRDSKENDGQSGGRFTKGQSGNPLGRPKKLRGTKGLQSENSFAISSLAEIVSNELGRKVAVQESGGMSTMTMAQAMVRRATVEAAKGNFAAAEKLFRRFEDMQRQREAAQAEIVAAALEFKANYHIATEAFSKGLMSPPKTLPHPDDLVIDSIDQIVYLNGPADEAECHLWEASYSKISQIEVELDRQREAGSVTNEDYDLCRGLVERLHRIAALMAPDEETRRRPGFRLVDNLPEATKEFRALKKTLARQKRLLTAGSIDEDRL
jgi:hypothetical protein